MSLGIATLSVGQTTAPSVSAVISEGCGTRLADVCWSRASVVSVPVATITLLARAEPHRGRIGFCNRSANVVIVTTVADPNDPGGISVPTPGLLWLTPSDAAQLTTFDWYCINNGAAPVNITVYELFQR
jgi:hypothetical protein